ncbi:MAG: universal stress protein [Flavobacterium sp.]
MKKILFPTDFSEVANNAFVHALSLAKLVHGELILLHTYELPIVDNQFAPQNYQVLFDSLELSNFEKFKDEVPKLRAIAEENHFGDIKMSHMILDGDLMYNIKEIIKKDKIDYVVMGTSGATGWKEAFLGTNTGEAIVNLSVPVLSIPKDCKYTKIETIGFTTRYREKDKEALKQVIKIAKTANAKVKCLYVKTKATDNTEVIFDDWNEQFKNDPVTFFILPNEDVKESISDFITHQEIDVLAMLTYKRSFFESLFSSSFTEKMSYNSEIPILALHQ